MTMFILAIIALMIVITITLIARYLPLYFTIPAMTAVCYAAAIYFATFFGYPISQKYVEGQTARVLYVVGNFILVHFEKDDKPRLIVLDSERDAMEAKKEQSDSSTFITFGKSGGGSETKGAGEGSIILDSSTIERKKVLLKPVE